MKKSMVNKLCVCLVALFSLTGCGFHLRGYQSEKLHLRIVYLQTPNPYDPFSVQLRNELISMQINVVKSQAQAPVTLDLISAVFNQNLASISESTQVRTYTLTYVAVFQLMDAQGRVIYGPQTVTATMPYTTSDAQLLADSQELKQLQVQMQHELIMQLVNRMNSSQAQNALAKIA